MWVLHQEVITKLVLSSASKLAALLRSGPGPGSCCRSPLTANGGPNRGVLGSGKGEDTLTSGRGPRGCCCCCCWGPPRTAGGCCGPRGCCCCGPGPKSEEVRGGPRGRGERGPGGGGLRGGRTREEGRGPFCGGRRRVVARRKRRKERRTRGHKVYFPFRPLHVPLSL